MNHEPAPQFARRGWQVAIRAFLVSRLFVAVFVYCGHAMRDQSIPIRNGWSGVANGLLNPWTTFDSLYFINIAREGYANFIWTAFFPLYPALLRLAGTNETAVAAWGVTLSNLCLLVGLVFIYQIAFVDKGDQKHAERAVWLLAFWPATAAFSAVYSDSLFLMPATIAFWNARRNAWLAAGMWACFAALSRNAGPILGAALLIEYFRTRDTRARRWHVAEIASLLLAPLAFVAVQWSFTARFGSGILLRAQDYFMRTPSVPWFPILSDVRAVLTQYYIGPATVINVVAAMLGVALAISFLKRAPAAALFLGAVTIIPLCYARPVVPHTFSIARYVGSAWPFAIGLASLYAMTDRSSRLRALWNVLYLAMCAACCYQFALKEALF